MYPHLSRSNFTADNIDERKNIKNVIDGNSNDHQLKSGTVKRSFIGDESSSTTKKPKIVNLKQSPDDEKTLQNYPSTSEMLSRSVIKKELHIKLYRCDINYEKNPNASSLKKIEQKTLNTREISKQYVIKKELRIKLYRCDINSEKNPNAPSLKKIEQKILDTIKTSKQSVIRKELISYHPGSFYCKGISSSIYRNAIKRIGVDSNGLFKDCVSEKISKIFKKINFSELSPDLSKTYYNVRKYALGRIYPLFYEDTFVSDVLITPGISILDLKSKCISNSTFFKKLRGSCEKVAEDIRTTPDSYLSHVFQSYIFFSPSGYLNSTDTKIKIYPPKKKILPRLKDLIIDTISNLPNSIICEIEKLDQNDIVRALFSDVHGVLVSKLLVKNLNLLSNSNKSKFINLRFDSNQDLFDDDLNLLNELFDKIANLVRGFCMFKDGFFFPDESTVEQLSKHLLSDMYGVSCSLHKKLKLSAQNILKPQELVDNIKLDHNYTKDMVTVVLTKEELQILADNIKLDHNYTLRYSKWYINKSRSRNAKIRSGKHDKCTIGIDRYKMVK
ncbi:MULTISPECIES: hypothetical protein [Candidatus Ichthyocystis]|uniref:Uncharacterized protein n=1 Tax=Candidatus Ichthyocystis hellenicum TaxID=1561003 RepID=A0A0S4M7M2_9BURK|nr:MULTISPECIES: hypothetical protein [Ichthyocystis]CUT18269.1 hypothetical protein Ark11_1471 [Candidatus Ichthyocystis hellenicum]